MKQKKDHSVITTNKRTLICNKMNISMMQSHDLNSTLYHAEQIHISIFHTIHYNIVSQLLQDI